MIEIGFSHKGTDVRRKFLAPIRKFAIHYNKKGNIQSVLNIDVSSGGLGASCSTDGSLLIWLTENGQVRVR